MTSTTHLHFHTQIGNQKPRTVVNATHSCPFCDRESLEGIMAEEGSIVLLKNKYPVLKDTLQTVIIETDICDSELSLYPKEHLHALIRFGLDNWFKMIESGEFTSVLFFKNHGPLSGGTIAHPHMQIVGLKDVDYLEHVQEDHFEGLLIEEQDGVLFNISTKPRIGFFEFNVVLNDRAQVDRFADYIQITAHYVMNHFNKNCNSYNLFFYQLEGGRIACKIMPRFVTTPLFVGFSIPQVSDRLPQVVEEIRERYLTQE